MLLRVMELGCCCYFYRPRALSCITFIVWVTHLILRGSKYPTTSLLLLSGYRCVTKTRRVLTHHGGKFRSIGTESQWNNSSPFLPLERRLRDAERHWPSTQLPVAPSSHFLMKCRHLGSMFPAISSSSLFASLPLSHFCPPEAYSSIKCWHIRFILACFLGNSG